MARLSRYTQLIFGSAAGTNQMSEFGSLAAGSPQTYNGSTITPAIIQTLANYLEGWFGAVIGQNSPAIEDMNALCYLYAFQLAYLFQAGISEWDSATTYYTGSLVQDGSGAIYNSLSNSNTGNALTTGTAWTAPILPGAVIPKAVPYSAGFTVPANDSMIWPNMQIGNGKTVTVPSNAYLVGITNITTTGTGTLTITGTGVVRII